MSEISAENISQPEALKEQYFQMGTVTALFPTVNTAQVTFDGETAASEKQYAYLSSYKPAINDRVFLAAISGTYIILGATVYNEAPGTAGSFSSLLISSAIGFFGTGLQAQRSVSDPSAITTTETADTTYSSNEVTMLGHLKTDVTNLQSKLKALLDALQAYGLIGT